MSGRPSCQAARLHFSRVASVSDANLYVFCAPGCFQLALFRRSYIATRFPSCHQPRHTLQACVLRALAANMFRVQKICYEYSPLFGGGLPDECKGNQRLHAAALDALRLASLACHKCPAVAERSISCSGGKQEPRCFLIFTFILCK